MEQWAVVNISSGLDVTTNAWSSNHTKNISKQGVATVIRDWITQWCWLQGERCPPCEAELRRVCLVNRNKYNGNSRFVLFWWVDYEKTGTRVNEKRRMILTYRKCKFQLERKYWILFYKISGEWSVFSLREGLTICLCKEHSIDSDWRYSFCENNRIYNFDICLIYCFTWRPINWYM